MWDIFANIGLFACLAAAIASVCGFSRLICATMEFRSDTERTLKTLRDQYNSLNGRIMLLQKSNEAKKK